jgi:hypothetical protein
LTKVKSNLPFVKTVSHLHVAPPAANPLGLAFLILRDGRADLENFCRLDKGGFYRQEVKIVPFVVQKDYL